MIGKEKAVEIYFSKAKKANEKIDQISKWDYSKSLKENAGDVGLNYGDAYALCRKYRLYKK